MISTLQDGSKYLRNLGLTLGGSGNYGFIKISKIHTWRNINVHGKVLGKHGMEDIRT